MDRSGRSPEEQGEDQEQGPATDSGEDPGLSENAIPYVAIIVTLGTLLIEGKSVIENYQKSRSSAAKVVDMAERIVGCVDSDTAQKIIKAIKEDSNNHKKPTA